MTNPKEALEWYERKRVEARAMADRDCNNCKHYSVKGRTTQFGFCGYRHAGTDETDHCSRAVRRKP